MLIINIKGFIIIVIIDFMMAAQVFIWGSAPKVRGQGPTFCAFKEFLLRVAEIWWSYEAVSLLTNYVILCYGLFFIMNQAFIKIKF